MTRYPNSRRTYCGAWARRASNRGAACAARRSSYRRHTRQERLRHAERSANAQANHRSLRRKEDLGANWTTFKEIVEGNTERVCKELSTCWLVSVADTYINMGSDVERRNAMLLTMLCNFEKVSHTFLHWRVYENPFDVSAEYESRKIRLWDGATSMHLEIGDVTNKLFRRLHTLMAPTPHLFRIFQEVVARMKTHPTTMAALDRRRHHVFEPELKWRAGLEYDQWLASGELALDRP